MTFLHLFSIKGVEDNASSSLYRNVFFFLCWYLRGPNFSGRSITLVVLGKHSDEVVEEYEEKRARGVIIVGAFLLISRYRSASASAPKSKPGETTDAREKKVKFHPFFSSLTSAREREKILSPAVVVNRNANSLLIIRASWCASSANQTQSDAKTWNRTMRIEPPAPRDLIV